MTGDHRGADLDAGRQPRGHRARQRRRPLHTHAARGGTDMNQPEQPVITYDMDPVLMAVLANRLNAIVREMSTLVPKQIITLCFCNSSDFIAAV